MYKYKDTIIKKSYVEDIEKKIIYTIDNFEYSSMENIKEIDYFIENISYIQRGKKDLLEVLSYTKYKLGEYLLSFQYGLESFSFNKNSFGVLYSILSLLNLELYQQAYFMFKENEEKVIDIINSNKCNIDDFIDLLIYFKIPLNHSDDLNYKINLVKDKRKKYLYILVNFIERKKLNLIKEKKDLVLNEKSIKKYKECMHETVGVLKELNLEELIILYKIKIDNSNNKDIYSMLPCDNLPKYICKLMLDILDFEDVNDNYIPNKISKYEFKDDFIKIFSYKGKSLVSMHILKIKDEYIIIDCGAEVINSQIKKINIDKLLNDNNIPKDKLKTIIISHAHLDHYGSLDVIQPYINKIYMTKDTYNIINIVSTEHNIDLKKLRIKKENETFYINNLKVTFFSSNHIKGSVGICIEYENKKIIYTGDFSFNRQSTTRYINENNFFEFKNADYLIMETTNGNKKVSLPYSYNKKLFNYFTNLSVKNKKKVLIPSATVGITQEYYGLIKNSTIKAKILIDGLATKINKYYNEVDKNNNIDKDIDYKRYKSIYQKYYENDVIILSGGFLKDKSISQNYYNLALKDSNLVTILNCGSTDKDIIKKNIKPYDTIKINLIEMSLSSHAQYEDLIKTINIIKPKNLIMVHGNGIELYNNLCN
ncbi:MAG: MBL fold metallo-hydrolase [Romboutsia sp.]